MFKNWLTLTNMILLGLCLFFNVIGCQPVVSEGKKALVATEATSNDQMGILEDTPPIILTRPTPQSLTLTPIPPLVNYPSPQSTQTPLPPATSTLTPLLTETTVPTPWPTLSPDEAINKVLSLLENNQNPDCLLPCWWGATPGQTQWWGIQAYLQSFSLQTYEYPQDSLYIIAFSIPSRVSYLEELHIGFTVNVSGTISTIGVPSLNLEGYDPRTMMALYGIPDEVWLKTFSELLPGEVLPFQLIIVYQEQGISLRYYVNATRAGETVTACFEPGVVELERPDLFPVGPRIYVWVPGQHKTIDEIANIPQETYFPLEEKTDLTPQTLYEKFTNPSEQPCIDTPADLWR